MKSHSSPRVITADDVRTAPRLMSAPVGTIITPLAREMAEKLGVTISIVTATQQAQDSGHSCRDSCEHPALAVPELASHIDHTNLLPTATELEIATLCDEARTHGFAAVCVAPVRVHIAAIQLSDSQTRVSAVVGYPSGAHDPSIKSAEAELAVQHGATEVDMVASSGWLLDGALRAYADDITAVRKVIGDHVTLKVIIEASLLSPENIVRAAVAAAQSGADMVKTSTGVYGHARLEDVRLLRRALEARVGIKAAGGIKTAAQAFAFISAGAGRIGTSSSVAIMAEASRLAEH